MKRILVFILFILVMISCNAQDTTYKSVSVDDFQKLLSQSNVICVDVRTQAEYNEGHIANSILLDVKNPEFEQQALQILPKDKTIAVYCRSGKRSKLAASILAKKGYTVVDLNNGIIGWSQSGKSITH